VLYPLNPAARLVPAGQLANVLSPQADIGGIQGAFNAARSKVLAGAK
jgi:hypothetical protein